MESTERIATGINGLDSQLGGGVPRGTSVLLISDSTNALYQFLAEVAAEGVSGGESVFWFELDRPAGLALPDLKKAAARGEGSLTLLDVYEPKVGQVSTNGSGPTLHQLAPADVPAYTAKVLADVEPGAYRLLLTSLSSLRQALSADDVQGYLRQTVAMGHHLGGLHVFSAIREAHTPSEIARMRHACTAVFELGMERKGFGLYSYLKVEKLLGVADAARLLLFNETDQGLRLESTRRVF